MIASAILPLLFIRPDPTFANIRKEIEAARKASPVPGMSVAIVRDGKIVFAEGFGWADVAKHRKATADTVYDIGSCTKAFTALLATQTQAEGKLSLADRPTKYLPAFRLKDPKANEKITLEDMLSHRSGIARTDLAMITGQYTRDELMQLIGQTEPTAPLGQKWQYQNLMFAFMGSIIEKATGQGYDALLRERFFVPLGMAHSSSTYAATLAQPRLATGYAASGASDPVALRNIDAVGPAGSISSNVLDMGNYLRMLLGDGAFEGRQLFAKDAVEEPRKTRIELAPGTGQFYGLGWMMSTQDGVKRLFHGGNIDGFTANVALVPSLGIGVVALSNGDSAALPQQATDIVLDALIPKKAGAAVGPFVEATPAELGDYRLAAPPVDVSFAREGKRTFMIQNGQRIPLELIGPKRYTIQKVVYLTFGEPVEGGKTTVKLEQAGKTFSLVPAMPFKADLSAEQVLAKEVQAAGGADAIRRHDRFVERYHTEMPNEGLQAYGIRYRRDAVSAADFSVFYGLNRRFANVLEATDGQAAIRRLSFMAPSVKRGPGAADALLSSNLLADLEPGRFYKSLKVAREEKIGDAPVYVLEKTAPSGTKTTDFVSKADGRLLRRIEGSGLASRREEFSDFRNVDGLMIPFHTVATAAAGDRMVETIDSVRFDEAIPEWPFRAGS